jgi:hypothetical protein
MSLWYNAACSVVVAVAFALGLFFWFGRSLNFSLTLGLTVWSTLTICSAIHAAARHLKPDQEERQ